MAIKLHRCMFTFIHADKDRCYIVQKALDDQGIESVLRFYDSYFQVFEGIVWEELSFIAAGQYVVAPNMSRSRGRDGIEVFARATFVFTVGDGKITRISLYQEQDEALKAVGLSE